MERIQGIQEVTRESTGAKKIPGLATVSGYSYPIPFCIITSLTHKQTQTHTHTHTNTQESPLQG